jgi:DNA-binding CsgD family transcriptional regulator
MGDLQPGSGEVDSSLLWNIFIRQPGIGVVIFRADGTYVYVNDEAARLFHGENPPDFTGKRIAELHTPEVATEWTGVLSRVAESRRPMLVRTIRRGVQLQSALWPVDDRAGREKHVLCVTRQGQRDVDNLEVHETQYIDLGPLDVLTSRELEVLALLGQGLNIPQIAQTIHRSPRTIERHRDSIAAKLKVRDRVGLAQLAQAAGLELRDAALKRRS